MPSLQGILPTQGLNLCLLHWQADSLPIEPPGKSLDSYHEEKTKNLRLGEVINPAGGEAGWARVPEGWGGEERPGFQGCHLARMFHKLLLWTSNPSSINWGEWEYLPTGSLSLVRGSFHWVSWLQGPSLLACHRKVMAFYKGFHCT